MGKPHAPRARIALALLAACGGTAHPEVSSTASSAAPLAVASAAPAPAPERVGPRPCDPWAPAAPLAFAQQTKTFGGEVERSLPELRAAEGAQAGVAVELGAALAAKLGELFGGCEVVRNDGHLFSAECRAGMSRLSPSYRLDAGKVAPLSVAHFARGGEASALAKLDPRYRAGDLLGVPETYLVPYADALVFGVAAPDPRDPGDVAPTGLAFLMAGKVVETTLPAKEISSALACDTLLGLPPELPSTEGKTRWPLAFAPASHGQGYELPRFVALDAWGRPAAAALNADLGAFATAQGGRRGFAGRDCVVRTSTERVVSVLCRAPSAQGDAVATGISYRLGPAPARIELKDVLKKAPASGLAAIARACVLTQHRSPPEGEELKRLVVPKLAPSDIRAFALEREGAVFAVASALLPGGDAGGEAHCVVPYASLGTSLDALAPATP